MSHMMSMIDLVAIYVDSPEIDWQEGGLSLEKGFTELININS